MQEKKIHNTIVSQRSAIIMNNAIFQICGINSRRSRLMFGLAHLWSNISNNTSDQNRSFPQKLPALSEKQLKKKSGMYFVHINRCLIHRQCNNGILHNQCSRTLSHFRRKPERFSGWISKRLWARERSSEVTARFLGVWRWPRRRKHDDHSSLFTRAAWREREEDTWPRL